MTSIDKMTTEQKVELANRLNSQLHHYTQKYLEIWWYRAEILYHIKHKKLYKFVHGTDLTDIVDSWQEYCYGVDLPVSTANYMVRIYKTFIIEHQLKVQDVLGIPTRKLDKAAWFNISNIDDVLLYAGKVDDGGMSLPDFKNWLEETFKRKTEV